MVCLADDTNEITDKENKNDIIDLMMEDYGRNEWHCQRIAGGSVIEHSPIFSPTGE